MFIEALLCAAIFKGVELLQKRRPPQEVTPVSGDLVAPEHAVMRGAHTFVLAHPDAFEADQDRRFVLSSANLAVAAAALINPVLLPLAAGGVMYISSPVFKRALEGLVEEGKVGNDFLVTLGFVVMTTTGHVAAVAMGCWFYFLGNKVQRQTRAQARARLSELFLQAPETVWVLRDSVEVSMALNQLHAGDVVVARAGEIIAIDGVIVDGQALIDQHLLTGESQPAEKGIGDSVLASTVVLAGKLHVRAQFTGQKTTTARIAAMLEGAADQKSSHQLKGEAWADRAAMPLLATAGAAMVLVGPVPAAIVLSSGIGNRIRLLAPLGTLNYLKLAAAYGFLVKDGRALEQLRSVDTVLFDKTGTLTRNQLLIHRVTSFDDLGEHDVIRYAAMAERRQLHPIARTILKQAADLELQVPDIDDFNYTIGYGISVRHDGALIQVGSANFLTREGIALAPAAGVMACARERGHVLVLVAIDGRVGGAIQLEAAPRPELAAMLAALRTLGVTQTAIVSGDQEEPTRQLAATLGVDSYYAGILPDQKAEIVDQLQREGRVVCFIGDGVNDSLAMKKADVSISLLGASSFAMDAAQIVLMDADIGLANLGRLFELTRGLDRNLRHSLYLTLGFAAVNINGALFVDGFGVYTAYFIKQIGLFAGVGNAMLPLRERREVEKKKAEGSEGGHQLQSAPPARLI